MGEFESFETAMRRGGATMPGLPVMAAGLERHPIPGGGSRLIVLEPGDEITIIDREGLQPCEIVVWDSRGRSDPAVIGAENAGPPDGLKAMYAADKAGTARVLKALKKKSMRLGGVKSAHLFGDGSRAGELRSFTADARAVLLIGAPGGPMAADAQNPPTELVAYVKRARRRNRKPNLAAPDPLADPLFDQNIQPGNAHAYVVKAGQYIQIVDVKGRECTDFQAFRLRDLEKGREREICPATTRSLMGSTYPTPGLYSKFFTFDQNPLLQMVQDDCGRHDFWGLSCTARYYEDLGYPGHLNCSDNMSAELAAHDVAPRRSWPAMNFFFNTMVDATHGLGMDDPWSRPGDHVLMRALDDLVCVSTACPCDVDPANAWEPTDIQVRVYDDKEDFKPSIGFRMTADADVQLTRETGFHQSFAKHTRNFVEYKGFWLPQDMTGRGPIEEYWACREKAAIMDLSPLRKYEVTGPDAEKLMQLCVTRDMKKLSQGGVVYTAMCYEHGGMIDDGTVLRLGDTNFRWIGGTDLSGLWLREQAEKHGLDAFVRSSTDQLCNVAVQGPKSREILRDIVWSAPTQPTIDELGWFKLSICRLNDFHGPSLVISRTGYTGELGYEVFCHPKDAETVFDAIWKAGRPHGLAPLGLGALDMLRIEAGLVFADAEFCDQTDPFEAGIGFTVPLKTQTDDFIGRAALERRKANPMKKLVGLDIGAGVVPSNGDGLYVGRAQVGEITSAVKSPILGKVIALARLDVTHAEIGKQLEVGQLDGQQKRLPAEIVRFPHFDPTKERVKGDYE